MLIIVFHPSSVLVTVREKTYFFREKYCQGNKNHYGRFYPNSGVFCRIPVMALLEIMVKNKKTPVANHYGAHGQSSRRSDWSACGR